MIEIARVGAVQVLTLSSGQVNAQDVELLDELTDAVREQQRSGEGPLVITGAGRAFSAGVDLNRVVEGGAAYTDRLVPALSNAFNAVFEFPRPTVAAINGAAIAGGCVLACACDRRLISPTAQIGASEVRVGVAFPVAALEVMRYACGDHAEEVLLGGRVYKAEEAGRQRARPPHRQRGPGRGGGGRGRRPRWHPGSGLSPHETAVKSTNRGADPRECRH